MEIMIHVFRSRGIFRWHILFLRIIFILGAATILHAEAPSDSLNTAYTTHYDQKDIHQTDIGTMVLKTIVSLVVVVGFVFVGMFLFKHLVHRKQSGGLAIRVVGSTVLGPKRFIYVIEVEGRRLLLGVTEASITMLAELEGKSSDEQTHPEGTENLQVPGKRFRELFESLVRKRGSDE